MQAGLFTRDPFCAAPVVDSAVLASTARIAAAMKIQTPKLWLDRRLGKRTGISAFVFFLAQPTVFITEGLIHRLSADERDAILAHELAHIANRSLWLRCAILPISFALVVLAGKTHDFSAALLLGLFFYVGARRILSRYYEADCDRRAAVVIGFSTMISALQKIHAAHHLRNRGFWSTLAYACATHPSREVRLSLLLRAGAPHWRNNIRASCRQRGKRPRAE
jgi:Zn-dependent protease with chaperone function